MNSSPGAVVLALLLAWNYFAFQVEIFDCEYEANHPVPHDTPSIVAPILSWESFDKDQAPPPYRFDSAARLEPIGILEVVSPQTVLPLPPVQPIRDKSPPLN